MHLHPSGCKHEQRHSSKTTKVETWITARKAFCKNQAINKPLAQRAIAHKNARQKHILLAKLGQVKHWSRHTLRKSQECNARSGGHWFTEFCNSQRLSRFAAPFTGARAKISIAESCGSWNNALPRQLSLKQLSLHSPARWTQTHGHRATLAPAPSPNKGWWVCICRPRVLQADISPQASLTAKIHVVKIESVRMILPQVHLRKPCYDFSFL